MQATKSAQNAGLNLPADDVKTMEGLRARLMPLVYNIEQMQAEMNKNPDAPPNWLSLHRATALLNTHLTSIQRFINSPETNEKNETNAQVLRGLHPYPSPPFPIVAQEGLASTLIRKKPEVKDEKWVDERLRKASEFCRVPSEWNIEPKNEGGVSGSESKDQKDEYGGVRRVKSDLSEDEISELWNDTFQMAFNKMALFNKAVRRDETDDDEAEEIEQIEAIRRECGMSEDETPVSTPEAGATEAEQGALPLGMMLKFMSTGSTEK